MEEHKKSEKNNIDRTVKTLLLCKLKPDRARELNNSYYSQQYNNLYPTSGIESAKYITMGNVDAISIYNTVVSKDENPNWFKKILDDRKQLIQETNENVNYHPIHLVANRRYKAGSKRSPFCIVSLIYGIYPDKNEEYHWTDNLLKNEKEPVSEESSYEAKLHNFYSNQHIPQGTTYEIYNAVNICDAVIIWNTDNLLGTLKLSGMLNHLGFARKTFTLVGFLWDGTAGQICRETLKLLCECSELFSVRIQGSIRNQADYESVINAAKSNALAEGIDINRARDFIICGQSDFSILLPDITGATLSWLLSFYMCDENNVAISKACWEIHTELMYKPDQPTTLSLNNDPCSILNVFFRIEKELQPSMNRFPWFGAFYELLSVHANIDKHPILYGPGYCIYYFLLISFSYFAQSSTSQNYDMLIRSKDSIQEFIRGWTNFTDQLLRIDDLVFHGFGNSTALYSTLPECALDFYHSLILLVVDLLVDVDNKAGRIGNNREAYMFDFLLLPKLDRGVSIMPVFAVDDNPQDAQFETRVLWPQKQAFLVYFPIETVFSPIQFFAPLVHECFHYYGDACRKREKRLQYVCRFISGLIVDCLGHNTDTPQDNALWEGLVSALCYAPESMHVKEPNEQQTLAYLNQRLYFLFSEGGFNEICNKTGNNILLYEKDTATHLPTWRHRSWTGYFLDDSSFLSPSFDYLTENCMYYFKECYADFMMILVLDLSPLKYLELFQNDVNNAEKELSKFEKARTAQRIALVFAVASTVGKPCWQAKEIFDALAQVRFPDSFFRVIEWCYCGLTIQDVLPPEGGIPDDILQRVNPMISLKMVMAYLEDVFAEFGTLFLSDKEISQRLKNLQDLFEDIFIDAKFLSKQYFEIIHHQHEHIRKNKEQLEEVLREP